MKKLVGSDVVVTGGLGFIGSHLVKRLVSEKANVHVFGLGSKQNLKGVLDKITMHRIDLRRYDSVKKALERIKPNKIFHLAAHVNVSRNLNYRKMLDNNFNGTVNLLKAAESIDYDCFIRSTDPKHEENVKNIFQFHIPFVILGDITKIYLTIRQKNCLLTT